MNKIKVLLKKLHSLPDNMLFGYRMTFTSAPLLTVMMSLNYLLQRLMPLFEAFALKEMINGIINEASYISILIWTAAFVGAGIVSKLIVSLGHLTFSALEKKTIHKINTILIDKIVSSDLSFFDSPKDHNVLNVVEENRYLINNISWQSIWMAANIASLAAAVFLLVAFSPAIALLNALCVIPAVILNKNYYDFIWRYDWIKSNDYRKMYYFYDVLTDRGYAEEMRLYNNGSYFANLYFNMWRSWYRDKNKYGIRHNFRMFGANLLQTAAMAVTFVSSVLSFAAGKIGIGNIQYYVNLSEQVKSSLVGIFKTVTDMQVDSQKISVIRDFLNWEPKIQSQGRLIPSRMPEIEFRNVGFKYPDTDRYVLKNCSFTIKSGEKVAFVGLNGAGKSTIVKLLLRFYDPDEGEILFDGVDAKNYDLKALRHVFGAQFQNFATYSMSAGENVTIGDISTKDANRLREALAFSGADSFVSGFKKRIDTQITRLFDENGEELSGGQKQKLALARAFYRNAGIMILDEPSASLDPEAEHAIFCKFVELWKDRGAILISHRLSNVTLCDRIMVINGCGITESGTHAELMKRDGEYARLFNLQAKKYKQG